MKHTLPFLTALLLAPPAALHAADGNADRVAVVTKTPGLVAFWDFVKREPAGARRFTAHVPTGATTDYPLEAANYIKDYWGAGREATYADFPLLGRGPFGNAIRIVKETDPDFRPFLFVPRARLHDTPLDIKGAGKSVTVVVWAIREGGNHALAGIWHEGTDLKQKETTAIARVERGQLHRQFPHPPDPLQHLGNKLPGLGHGHRAAPHVLQEPALKRPATLRAMRVDAAPFSLQRPARLHQQPAACVILLDLQPHDLQPRSLRRAGQFHVGKQRPVATQPAPRAERVRQAWFHAGTMADRHARGKRRGEAQNSPPSPHRFSYLHRMGEGGGMSFHSKIEPLRGVPDTHVDMGKAKSQATGDGYLGEIMVHRTTGAVGIVDNVHGASAGWTPEITLKLKDGSFKRGRLNEFREPRAAERKQFSPS